jgi:hypothetical protein
MKAYWLILLLLVACASRSHKADFIDQLSEEVKLDDQLLLDISIKKALGQNFISQGRVNLAYESNLDRQVNRFETAFDYRWLYNITQIEDSDEYLIKITFITFNLLQKLNGIENEFDLTRQLKDEVLRLKINPTQILSVEGSENIVSKILNNTSAQSGVDFANFFLPQNIMQSFWPIFEIYFVKKQDEFVLKKNFTAIDKEIELPYQFEGWFQKAQHRLAKLTTAMDYPGTRKIKVPFSIKYKNTYYFDQMSLPRLAESFYAHKKIEPKGFKQTTITSSIFMSEVRE